MENKHFLVFGAIAILGLVLMSGCAQESQNGAETGPAGLCLIGIEGHLFSVVDGDVTTNYLVRAYEERIGTYDQSKVLTQNELEDWMEDASGTRDITLSICAPEASESEALEIVNCLMEHKSYESMPGVKNLEFISLVHSISDDTYCAYRFHGKDENGTILCVFDVSAKAIDDPYCARKITRSGCAATGQMWEWGYEFTTEAQAIEIMRNYLEENNILGELSPNVHLIYYSHLC